MITAAVIVLALGALSYSLRHSRRLVAVTVRPSARFRRCRGC